MTGPLLGILLDLVVLIFLGVTIFYALRLSKSLNVFRETRHEFATIMRTLTKNIEDAQRSVEMLKNTSKESGQLLQKTLNESRVMISELEIINQSANKLAQRLEGLTDHQRNQQRNIAAGMEEPDVFEEHFFEDEKQESGFFIHDREFETPESTSFQSQAEKDLYEALQKSRKAQGRA